MTLGSRVALMRAGRFEQVGPPIELYTRPATRFAAEFIGSPGMNLIEGRIENGKFSGEGIDWPIHAPEGAATLGVRPEDLVIGETGWPATVDLVENLGADVLVHLLCGEKTLVTRTTGDPPNIEASVRIQPRRIHLFGLDGDRLEPAD